MACWQFSKKAAVRAFLATEVRLGVRVSGKRTCAPHMRKNGRLWARMGVASLLLLLLRLIAFRASSLWSYSAHFGVLVIRSVSYRAQLWFLKRTFLKCRSFRSFPDNADNRALAMYFEHDECSKTPGICQERLSYSTVISHKSRCRHSHLRSVYVLHRIGSGSKSKTYGSLGPCTQNMTPYLQREPPTQLFAP